MKYLDSIHHSSYLFSIFVCEIKSEMLFHGQDKFDSIKGVETKLLERGSSWQFRMITFGSRLQDFENFTFYEFNNFIFVETRWSFSLRLRREKSDLMNANNWLPLVLEQSHEWSGLSLGNSGISQRLIQSHLGSIFLQKSFHQHFYFSLFI